jgi:DNA polymerase-4
VRTEATILHADVDAFFAAVEQRDRPELRGRPVIVGGGVVLCPSYEPKARGVQLRWASDGRFGSARAVVISPRMSAYSGASKAVYRVFDDTTPLVEEARSTGVPRRAELRRLSGSPLEIATRLHKPFANAWAPDHGRGRADEVSGQVASGVAKPEGLLLVPPGRELEFCTPRSSTSGASAR